jgi:uncharacterized LabA/DUF88 family protein
MAGIFYKEDRTALFVDGPNLYSASRGLGFDLDYQKILEFFETRTKLFRAFYYSALLDTKHSDSNYQGVRPLLDYLSYNGWSVVSKLAKTYADPQGNLRTKGNMDIELAIDMLQLAYNRQVDNIVLFSGDSDFRRLVEACQLFSKVTVISTVRSSPPVCSDELRRQANIFIDLQDLKKYFEREQRQQQQQRTYSGIGTGTGSGAGEEPTTDDMEGNQPEEAEG